MKEIWKDVCGYEGVYQVSSMGRVKSLIGTEKIRQPVFHRQGYLQLSLHKDGTKKLFLIHRLVALAFIPNLHDKPDVNHKDGNKSNNSVENLEWVNCSENNKHAYSTKLKKPLLGQDNVNAKLDEYKVKEIKNLLKEGNFTQRQIASMFGVYNTTISAINTQKTWSHIK